MAVEGEARELKAHEKSYVRFISMMKWATALSVITAFIVILLISN